MQVAHEYNMLLINRRKTRNIYFFLFKHILLLNIHTCTSKRVGPQVLPTLVTALPEKKYVRSIPSKSHATRMLTSKVNTEEMHHYENTPMQYQIFPELSNLKHFDIILIFLQK